MTSCSRQDKDLHTLDESLTFLTSDECMGRLPGTEGNEKAASYIADKYAANGLDTYDDDYYHMYKQSVFDPATATQELTVVFKDQTEKNYIFGTDFLGSMNKNASIKAEVTTDTNDIDNKIVLLDENSPPFNLSKSKAVGLFTKKDTLFKSNYIRESNKNHVKITDKLYNDLTTKDVDHVLYKDNVSTENKEVNNVVGIIKGEDSTKALVLSAHFDHVGYAGDTIFRGAVDNASGIAIMLELAERLKKSSKKKPFEMDIIFSAFNGEEFGLLGSKAFSNDIKKRYQHIYNINVDCVGKKDGGKLSTNSQREETGLNTELKKALLKSFSESDVELVDVHYGMSDHGSFNDLNFPGITIGQSDVMGENDTTSIHTPEDTLDMIDYDYMNHVVDAIYNFIIDHDGMMFQANKDVSLSRTLLLSFKDDSILKEVA